MLAEVGGGHAKPGPLGVVDAQLEDLFLDRRRVYEFGDSLHVKFACKLDDTAGDRPRIRVAIEIVYQATVDFDDVDPQAQ